MPNTDPGPGVPDREKVVQALDAFLDCLAAAVVADLSPAAPESPTTGDTPVATTPVAIRPSD